MEENQLNNRIEILEEDFNLNLNDLDTLEELKQNKDKLLKGQMHHQDDLGLK